MNNEKVVNETIKQLTEGKILLEMTEEAKKQCEQITLLVRDPDKNLEKLLDCIKSYSTAGHSFPIVVDPDDSEMRQEFYIDGDGADSLLEINIKEGEKEND